MTTLDQSAVPVEAFDPAKATLRERLAVGQLSAVTYQYLYPDDPPLSVEKEAHWLLFESPGEESKQFVVWEGELAVGWGKVTYHTLQNLHHAFVQLRVHPDFRRRGIARALWPILRDAAVAAGRNVLTAATNSIQPGGEEFARSLGAEIAQTMHMNRLDLLSVDQRLLECWTRRPADDPFRLHLWRVIPEEYIERLADLEMVMNTAPKGELELDDWLITPEMLRAWEKQSLDSGDEVRRMVAEDSRTGELVGFTFVYWEPDRPSIIYQGGTAVRPTARGQGLGKWLKAAMLQEIQRSLPQARWVRTNNATENAAMLGINAALGFESWASNSEWQLKLSGHSSSPQFD